jgi:hypothetical protein
VPLKSYQRLGYFPNLAEVPVAVVAHVRGQLGLAESVTAGHDAVAPRPDTAGGTHLPRQGPPPSRWRCLVA